ncbi:ABC transporter permease [Fulvivirga lutea]|uniref:ABC transporter permease n=1 Tax=Fulvivirga lutea TaxID=2810512 RepID=UPI001F21963C|nr:FtsX-like permease family protein [Fulvivirga lutea]
MLIAIFAFHEYSYDRHNAQAERLYIVNYQLEFGNRVLELPQTPALLTNEVKKFEGVEKASRLYKISNAMLSSEDESFIEEFGYAVDSDFLNMFTFQTLAGSIEKGFTTSNEIILTDKLAVKYFGNQTAIGKTICLDKENCYQVLAVINDLPTNSNFEFDYLLPFDHVEKSGRQLDSWGRIFSFTYVLLDAKNDLNSFNENLDNLVAGLNEERDGQKVGQMYAQNILDIHWGINTITGEVNDNLSGGLKNLGSLRLLKIYLGIAGIILIIAIINFVNLSISIYVKRIKNVGLQKAIGASRVQLVFGYLLESTFYVLLATAFALLVADLLLPTFNQLLEVNLTIQQFLNQVNIFWLIISMAGFILLCGLLSGLYPALLITKVSFAQATHNKMNFGANGLITHVLIICQFAVAMVFVIGMFVVTDQLKYVQNLDWGFDKDELVTINLYGDLQSDIQALDNSLSELGVVERVAFTKSFPRGVSSRGTFNWEGKNPDNKVIFDMISASPNFLTTSGIKLVEGEVPYLLNNDSSYYHIINKKAYQEMLPDFKGREDEIIGSVLDGGKITGIVDDFMLWSAYEDISPVVIRISNVEKWRKALVKVNSSQGIEVAGTLEAAYKKHSPDYPFEMNFVDDDLDTRYSSAVRTKRIYSIGSILTIIISSLGLFGISAHSTQKRIKEIGIRKVLGASVQSIIKLMSKEYILLALISIIIAAPVAYYVLNNWLDNFHRKIEFNILPFIIGTLLTTIITVITVGIHAIKSARLNPAETLKTE